MVVVSCLVISVVRKLRGEGRVIVMRHDYYGFSLEVCMLRNVTANGQVVLHFMQAYWVYNYFNTFSY